MRQPQPLTSDFCPAIVEPYSTQKAHAAPLGWREQYRSVECSKDLRFIQRQVHLDNDKTERRRVGRHVIARVFAFDLPAAEENLRQI
jgi:hypothetical protein